MTSSSVLENSYSDRTKAMTDFQVQLEVPLSSSVNMEFHSGKSRSLSLNRKCRENSGFLQYASDADHS